MDVGKQTSVIVPRHQELSLSPSRLTGKCLLHPTPSFVQLLVHISSEKDLLYIEKIYFNLYS